MGDNDNNSDTEPTVAYTNFNVGPENKSPLWEKQVTLWKVALVTAALTLLVVGFFTAFLVTYKSIRSQPTIIPTEDICYTPECSSTGFRLLSNMNMSVDPCEDFYEFACGSFLNRTEIPAERESVDRMSDLRYRVYDQLASALAAPASTNETRPFRLLRSWYQACIDTAALESLGTRPLLAKLRQLGGWPVLDGPSWDSESAASFSWNETTFKLRQMGYSYNVFFTVTVMPDLLNNSKHIVALSPADQKLLTRLANVEGFNDQYYDFMVDTAVMLGADRARAKEELRESLDFELELYKLAQSPKSISYWWTVQQLQTKLTSIHWREYLNRLLSPHASIADDEKVFVATPTYQYIAHLAVLLLKTPKRVLANYAMWRVVQSSLMYLPERLRARELDFHAAMYGMSSPSKRHVVCVTAAAASRLSLSAGALYVRSFFNEDLKKNAHEMLTDIREQFREMVRTEKWLDDFAWRAALDKVDAMETQVGYPQELLDDAKLTDYYATLVLPNGTLLDSMLALSLFNMEISFGSLHRPANKSDWTTHGQTFIPNAFYNPRENVIQLPASTIQGLLSPERPSYIDYGAMGYIVGHEITHGFDNIGLKFDKDGNYLREGGSSMDEEKLWCIVTQYSNHTDKEVNMRLDGKKTAGENIADNGGVKAAYRAYEARARRAGAERGLPGLSQYSPRQMFWLSAASLWCTKYTEKSIRWRISNDVHSLSRYRVVVPFSNAAEFARDYKCPIGSKMNPKRKCVIW